MNRIDPEESPWELRTLRAGKILRPAWYRRVHPGTEAGGALEARLNLPAGEWTFWLEVIEQGAAFPSAAAALRVSAGDRLLPLASEPGGEGGWRWQRYGPWQKTGSAPVRLTVEALCPGGVAEAHAAVAQVLAAPQTSSAAPPAMLLDIEVAPGRTKVLSIHPAAPPLHAFVSAGDDYVLIGPPERGPAS
jgi:hypothetical protein